jgi:hypothetical protein
MVLSVHAQLSILLIGVIAWATYLSLKKTSFRAISNSWNPEFNDSTGALRNVIFTGNYNIIGKMIFFCVNVQFTNLLVLGTGQYQITLPFSARQTFTSRGGALHNPTTDAKYHIAGIADTLADPSKVIMRLYYSGSTTDLAWKSTTPVGWAGGSSTTTHFDISGFYETDY